MVYNKSHKGLGSKDTYVVREVYVLLLLLLLAVCSCVVADSGEGKKYWSVQRAGEQSEK